MVNNMIGQNIEKVMDFYNIRPREVLRETGISTQRFYRIRNGEARKITTSEAYLIQDALAKICGQAIDIFSDIDYELTPSEPSKDKLDIIISLLTDINRKLTQVCAQKKGDTYGK